MCSFSSTLRFRIKAEPSILWHEIVPFRTNSRCVHGLTYGSSEAQFDDHRRSKFLP
jgi:hypothetical protein